MAKQLQHYIKYTVKELETYVATEHSCVRKVNTNMHLALKPFDLIDLKQSLHTHIVQRKLGTYDAHLNGIILDVKNIKLLDTTAPIRFDDARLHVNINANFYIFCPVVGAVLSGVVIHIARHHVGAIIYRVFNANIRFKEKINDEEMQLQQEIKFRIKNFNLTNIFPYIEGEMVAQAGSNIQQTRSNQNKKVRFSSDSGIEEREAVDIDAKLSIFKEEATIETERTNNNRKRKHQTKGATSTSERTRRESSSESSSSSEEEPKMKKSALNVKKESPSSDSSSSDESEVSTEPLPIQKIQIKQELGTPTKKNNSNNKRQILSNETSSDTSSDTSRTPTIKPIQIKKEKSSKKTKTKI